MGMSRSGMPVKDIFDPICTLAAHTRERSQIAASLVRNLDFKGKGRIVQRTRYGPHRSRALLIQH